jgi:hypothetical protein
MPARPATTGLAGGVLLVALVATGSVLMPGPVVTLTTDAGDRIACRSVAEEETFALVFTHSMYGGEVRETFAIADQRLIRTAVTTENAAAAEYYAYDGQVEPDPDGFRVIVSPLPLDEVVIQLDRIGQQRLRFGDTEIALTEPGTEPTRAILKVASMPLIARVFWSSC